MSQFSRRNFVKGAGIGAASLAAAGILGACSSGGASASSSSKSASSSSTPQYTAEVLNPTATYPEAKSGHNYDIVPESKTTVGTTKANLLTAITGETGATTKYAAWAKVAEKDGYSQLARLFTCTSDAEKIHIKLESERLKALDPTFTAPAAPEVPSYTDDINLIMAANGEIYETSDMYPSFIAAALAEGDAESAKIFTRAKLAEAYHAQRYLDAYSNIDTPSDAKYYLCPICGYIHKGENFVACPICMAPKSSFTAY